MAPPPLFTLLLLVAACARADYLFTTNFFRSNCQPGFTTDGFNVAVSSIGYVTDVSGCYPNNPALEFTCSAVSATYSYKVYSDPSSCAGTPVRSTTNNFPTGCVNPSVTSSTSPSVSVQPSLSQTTTPSVSFLWSSSPTSSLGATVA